MSQDYGIAEQRSVKYTAILAEVTDALEHSIFNYLASRPGESIRREVLILALFGRQVERQKLAADPDDRKIRAAIGNLQRRGVPILASAGSGGYVFTKNTAKLDSYIAELRSRQSELDAKIHGLQRSREFALEAGAYPERLEQPALFELRGVLP